MLVQEKKLLLRGTTGINPFCIPSYTQLHHHSQLLPSTLCATSPAPQSPAPWSILLSSIQCRQRREGAPPTLSVATPSSSQG